MVRFLQLDLTGFIAVLAGFIFLATGMLLFFHTANTPPDPVSLGVFRFLGVITALIGVFLLASRDE
jgi:membrane-bound ClpP family serine protease